jgi:hypothetical protein
MYICQVCNFEVDHAPTADEFKRQYPELSSRSIYLKDYECPRYKAEISSDVKIISVSQPCRGKLVGDLN